MHCFFRRSIETVYCVKVNILNKIFIQQEKRTSQTQFYLLLPFERWIFLIGTSLLHDMKESNFLNTKQLILLLINSNQIIIKNKNNNDVRC